MVPRSRSIRGVATSATFHRNWSVSSVLDAACWMSGSVFASLYLKIFNLSLLVMLLGPFIAAGVQIG